MSEGTFVVLKSNPHIFDHKNCEKNLCSSENSLCRNIAQGSSPRFIIEQAKSLNLGSFYNHPYFNFFKENEVRTENKDLIKTFLLDKFFIVETWGKYQKEKKLFLSRSNLCKEGFCGWLISSGLYLKYNKKHSYKKKLLIVSAGASFVGGGLFLYHTCKSNLVKKDA